MTTIDRTKGRRWLLLFCGVFPVIALWSVTNPMLASPDEPLHIVRAQSISNGDFDSPYTTDGIPISTIECFRFQSEVTAACQSLTWGTPGTQYDIPTDNYPAVFHMIAAIPAVFTSGLSGAYIMRLWLALIAAGVFAWAGVLLTRPRSSAWPLVGLCLSVTPMVVFSAATVNPSGLAAAATALLVTGVLSLNTAQRRRPEVIAAIAVGTLGLALMRRDGLVWLAIIAIVLAPLVGLARVHLKTRAPTKREWFAVASFIVLTCYVIASWAGPTIAEFLRGGTDGGTDAWEAARYVRTYLYHVIGTFGWLDSPIGEEPFLIAMIVAGFLVILGLVGTNMRLAGSTALGVAALLLAPVGFGMVRFPYFQGRYLIPLWICLLLVAGASAAASGLGPELSRRAPKFLLVVWAGVHAIGFVQNLRRYAVGRSGSWTFVFGGAWQPDTMSNVIAVVLFAVALSIAAVVIRQVLKELDPDGESDESSLDALATEATEATDDSDLFGEPA